jgi:hypothetical protein
MRSLRIVSLAITGAGAVLTLASCDLLSGPLPEALEGRYNATWTFSGLDDRGAKLVPDLMCQGGFRIEEASDSVLSGSYTIRSSPDCSVASGGLTGTAREDGGMNVEAGTIDIRFGECALDDVQLSLNGIGNRHSFLLEGRTAASCSNPDVAADLPITAVQISVYANDL